MSDETTKVEDVRIGDLNEEQVEGMAKQTATLMAGALFHLKVASNITENFDIMHKNDNLELLTKFKEELWVHLSQALDAGIAGLVKRNELAQTMREMNSKMLYEACVIAVNNRDSETPEEAIKIVEGLLHTAGYCASAADALYAGIRRNLDGLVSQNKQVLMMKEMAASNRAVVEDQMHDEQCDDPDCPGHTNH